MNKLREAEVLEVRAKIQRRLEPLIDKYVRENEEATKKFEHDVWPEFIRFLYEQEIVE